jgi:hypothetical protein
MAPVSPAPRSRTGRLPRQVFTLGRPRRRDLPLPSCKSYPKKRKQKRSFWKGGNSQIMNLGRRIPEVKEGFQEEKSFRKRNKNIGKCEASATKR